MSITRSPSPASGPPLVSSHLASAPSGCAGNDPNPQKIAPWFGSQMVGHDPAWGGFYAMLRGDTYHALDNIQRYRDGWAIKVLWLIRPGWTQPVTLAGKAVTGQQIWFRTGGIHPQGPVTSVVLDPENPEIPDVHNWANFPSNLLFPRASCYKLTASWSGGSWTMGFGFGK